MTGYLGVVIGSVTFTGSIVAFLKMAGRMSSRLTILPDRHLINSTLLNANAATINIFVTMTSDSSLIAANCFEISTALSFAKGYITTATIEETDMSIVITILNVYFEFALIAEEFMLNNAFVKD